VQSPAINSASTYICLMHKLSRVFAHHDADAERLEKRLESIGSWKSRVYSIPAAKSAPSSSSSPPPTSPSVVYCMSLEQFDLTKHDLKRLIQRFLNERDERKKETSSEEVENKKTSPSVYRLILKGNPLKDGLPSNLPVFITRVLPELKAIDLSNVSELQTSCSHSQHPCSGLYH